jgi:soluble lytic murein transglycosylase
MVMSPGPAFLLASAIVLVAGLRSGFATSGNNIGADHAPFVAVSAVAPPAWSRSVQLPPYAELLESANGDFDAAGVAALRRGLSLRGRDAQAAARAFAEAASRLPGLSDWALLLEADATAKAGDTATVRTLLERVEPGLIVVRGWRVRVDACRAASDPQCAAMEAQRALDRAPDATIRAAAATQLGRARLLQSDTTGAMAAFRVAIDASPSGDAALEAGRALSALRSATPEDRLALGRLYFRHGNPDRGMAGFDAYLARSGGSAAERAAVTLELARSLHAARRYSAAEPRLVALIREAADAGVTAEAKVVLGRTRLRLARTDAGIAMLESALVDPALPTAARADALFLLADAQDDRGATARARELYHRLLEDHPSTTEAADAAMRVGGAAFAAGRYPDAVAIFDRFRSAHPAGPRAQQAAYWSGQAHLVSGDTAAAGVRFAEARAADPTSLYGLRAAEHLAVPLRTHLSASPATDHAVARMAAGAVARIAVLREAGVDGAVATELGRARRFLGARSDGLYAIAEALNAGGMPIDAVRLGREVQRIENDWNERLLRIVYPFPWRDEIVAAADRRGLDPWFVAGLIRQESLFLPAIRSSAGAVGLMQVMPATGRELARRDGLRGFSPSMLTDPVVNIRLGTLFIADLLRRHDGAMPYALAAYNAGPSRVTRWLRLPDNGHPDVFAERIPFPETRDYVRIVQQNARIYAELYGPVASGNQQN